MENECLERILVIVFVENDLKQSIEARGSAHCFELRRAIIVIIIHSNAKILQILILRSNRYRITVSPASDKGEGFGRYRGKREDI